MNNTTHPAPTIHSASDKAAAVADASKGPSIRSASEENAPKAGATAEQAARALGQQPRPLPSMFPRTPAAGSLPDAGRVMELGSALTSGYESGFSQAASFMNQAVERQQELMSSMLQARGPQDVMMAGNRYLIGGWMAFFEANARMAQAAARLTQDAKHGPGRPGA